MFRRIAYLLVATSTLLGFILVRTPHQPALAATGSFSVSYTGTNYYQPTDYFNGCVPWTWLGSCYTNATGGVSPQQGVADDAQFIATHRIGTFHRVWISLDQLMNWDSTNGYQSYNSTYLGHVDDMLHRFAQYGIKVDLVLLTYSQGANAANEFHPEALDGQHPTMRANYLRAVRDFMSHLAADPVDLSTLAVVDLENEAYYQLDTYYNDVSHLGTFTNCIGGGGGTDWGCVENAVIHPWLLDLYASAKAAAPSVLYTVSDTGALLTTNTVDQQHWVSMYPVDVYDIHMYSNNPSTQTSRWAAGLQLPKPWFVGEAGCGIGNVSCTYDGTNAEPIDKWWIDNLKADGASAVLVEERGTAWTYPNGPTSPTLTITGQMMEQVALSNTGSASILTSSLGTTNAPIPTSAPPATSTPIPTSTPRATSTPIPTSTPRATSTPIPTSTPRATSTPIPTSTPRATSAPIPTSTPRATSTPIPTSIPSTLVTANQGTFWTNFDGQSDGQLSVGAGSGQFTGAVGGARLSVVSGNSVSGGNSLSTVLNGGGSAFAYKQFPNGAMHSDVRFKVRLGSDFRLGGGEYMVLAQTQTQAGSSSSVGKVNLVVNDGKVCFLTYVDSSGTQQYIWTSYKLDSNWHSIEIKETAGLTAGFLNLLVDGASVGGATAVDTGGQPVSYLGLGTEYTPNDTATTGHLYVDDVSMQLTN